MRSGTPASSVRLQATKGDLTLTVPPRPIDREADSRQCAAFTREPGRHHQGAAQPRCAITETPKAAGGQASRSRSRKCQHRRWRCCTGFGSEYEVTGSYGEILGLGIEAFTHSPTDGIPFVLTAAASRVASPGLPYRVQVHVEEQQSASR